jgi:hypothetical protein
LVQASALQFGVILDILILAQKQLPIAARGEQSQPTLAHGIRAGDMGIVLEKRVDFGGRHLLKASA